MEVVLVKALIAVQEVALDVEEDAVPAENVIERHCGGGAPDPGAGIGCIKPRPSVHSPDTEPVLYVDSCLKSFERVVETQIAVFVCPENQSIAHLVIDITDVEGKVFAGPADVLCSKEKLLCISLLTYFETVESRHIALNLQTCGQMSPGVVHLQVVVASEFVFRSGYSKAVVPDIGDTVALQTCGELARIRSEQSLTYDLTGLSSGQSPEHQAGKYKQCVPSARYHKPSSSFRMNPRS